MARHFILLIISLLFCLNGLGNSRTLKIGVLIENHSDIERYEEYVSQILDTRDFDFPMNIIVKSVDGPWGQTSNRVVDLIYTDGVHLVIGILDGRNAHLVEQVTAKSRIPYIELNSTDPGLSEANLPYFFRFSYSSNQLAKAIKEQTKESICYIGSHAYDSEKTYESLQKVYGENNVSQCEGPGDHHKKVRSHVIWSQDQLPYINDSQIASGQVYLIKPTRTQSIGQVKQIKWETLNSPFEEIMANKLVDAIILIASVSQTSPNISSLQIGEAIHKVTNFKGNTGVFSFDVHGNLMREVVFE